MRVLAKSPEANCIQCGTRFKPKRGSAGKFCCMPCKYEHQKAQKLNGRTSYLNCCKCHASLGFGIAKSAQFVGKEKGNISKGLNAAGIRRYEPEGGSWQVSAAIMRRKEKAWQDAWMDEYDFKFPDWKRSDFAHLFSRYQMMTIPQRKEHNRRTQERIRSCPIKLNNKLAQHNKWKLKNQDKIRKYAKDSMRKRKIIDPGFKVKCNLRNRLKDLMRTTKKGGSHSVSALIGCSTKQLAKHLESQFKKGMSWDNYGIDGWHVDHVLPCSSFDHNDPRQVAQCWHWTNLRPLWAKENMLKSDEITEPQMRLLL